VCLIQGGAEKREKLKLMSSSNGHLVAMEQWSGPERAFAVSAYY
jgi:hypothetical protein